MVNTLKKYLYNLNKWKIEVNYINMLNISCRKKNYMISIKNVNYIYIKYKTIFTENTFKQTLEFFV